jgi:two-component system sensor histidine kinase HupT/HoxJ
VRLALPPKLVMVGSAVQMQQVFINLVQNAYDAASAVEAPLLEVAATAEDGVVTVTLRDNGSGIAPENLPRIFDPFFTTKPVGKGTGLGLAISYGIVERHGGTLTAANAPQGGAVFTLRVPVTGGQAPA